MRFVATQKAISAAVKLLKGHVPKRAGLPVLTGVLVTPQKDGTLLMEGSDLESGIQLEVGATMITGEAEVLKLADLARAAGLNSAGGNLHYQDGTARVGDTSLRIERFEAQDWPGVPNMPDHWLEGDIEGLCQAIVTVAPASSSDQARPILTGVHLEPGEEEGTITAVATDSYRMAWQTVKANNLPLSQHNPNKGKPITLLIPAAKAKLAAATVPQVIAADDRYVFFGTTQAVTFVRLIDGAFPKWRSLVKDEKATGTWEVMGADLVSTLKTAPKDLDKIPVFIDFLQRELRLVHNGETAWSAPIPGTVSHKLTDTVIALNLPYFADSVKVCGEANLTIEIVDAMKPITITGVNGAKYLQMPVRI